MNHDCGHECCEIRDNEYHSHTKDPQACWWCRIIRYTRTRARAKDTGPNVPRG